MAKVYIKGGPSYDDPVPQQMQTVTRQVPDTARPALSFFGIPFGQRMKTVTEEVPLTTPVQSYGVNDTGRTYPFAPAPTMPNYTTTGGYAQKNPQWAGDAGGQASGSNGFGGGLLSLLFGGRQSNQPTQYEAALRERPDDVQNLVSMSRRFS